MVLAVILNSAEFLAGLEGLGTIQRGDLALTTVTDPHARAEDTLSLHADKIKVFVVNKGDIRRASEELVIWEDEATIAGAEFKKYWFTPGQASPAERDLVRILGELISPNSEHYRFYQMAGEQISWEHIEGRHVQTLLKVLVNEELAVVG